MNARTWSMDEVEAQVCRCLVKAPAETPAFPPATLYLDLAESVVRQATAWQTPEGMIGDPYNEPGVESVTATARYAAALGHLLATGRCQDLLEAASCAMDWCCNDMTDHWERGTNWPCAVFNMKDLLVLFEALEPFEAARRYANWGAQLRAPRPEACYFGTRNYLFYGLAAETLRIRLGLSDRVDYIDRVIEEERQWWTDHGMYRDPGDPATYDLTVRQCLAFMVENGYNGRHQEWGHEMLRKGTLTALLFVSPTGVAPCGGRSNQFHHLEGMIAYAAEHQAKTAWREGRRALAGALRGTALAAAEAAGRWMLRDPYNCTKNLMASQPFFGQDGFGETQNAHSGYGLLAANLFAGAYRVADQQIPPATPPSHVGGYVTYLPDAFHRLWATAGDYHIQVDTRGQDHYDPTGLVRVHRRGVPPAACLNMGIVPNPSYHLPRPRAERAVALGIGWPTQSGWRYLASANRDTHRANIRDVEEGREVTFGVGYLDQDGSLGTASVHEDYHLSPDGLHVTSHVPGAGRVRLQVPLVETDGEQHSKISLRKQGVDVSYRGHTVSISVPKAEASWLEPWPAPNRNGVYRVAVFEGVGSELSCAVAIT